MITQISLEKRTDELKESWINGNRKHVVGTLIQYTKKNVLIGLYLTSELTWHFGENDRSILLKLLNNKMN